MFFTLQSGQQNGRTRNYGGKTENKLGRVVQWNQMKGYAVTEDMDDEMSGELFGDISDFRLCDMPYLSFLRSLRPCLDAKIIVDLGGNAYPLNNYCFICFNNIDLYNCGLFFYNLLFTSLAKTNRFLTPPRLSQSSAT